MYLPPQFACRDIAVARDIARSHPLAQLISVDDDGLPFVTPLPLHWVDEGPKVVLLGHVAKPNPHARLLRDRPRARVVFQGPQAYMSPRVYDDLQRVPTWSYLALHLTVEARFIESFADKDRLLKHLIQDHDPAYDPQWRSLPEDYQQKMANGIHAFELHVIDWQCKVKLNQHRPESHAAMLATYEAGNENERALAAWMRRLGLGAAN